MENLRRRIPRQTESLFTENHEAFFNSIGHSRLGRASGMSSHVRCIPKTDQTRSITPEVAARHFNPYSASAVSASRTQYEVPTGMASSLKS